MDLKKVVSGQTINCELPVVNKSQFETRLVEAKVSGHSDGTIEMLISEFPIIVCPSESIVVNFRFIAKTFGRNKILIILKFCQKKGEEEVEFSCGVHVLAEIVDSNFKILVSNSEDERKFTNVRYLRDGDSVNDLSKY